MFFFVNLCCLCLFNLSGWYVANGRKINFATPSSFDETASRALLEKPAVGLVLDSVLGYGSAQTLGRYPGPRDNAFYTAIGAAPIVYGCEGIGVVFDPVTRTQRHFFGHSAPMQCLTWHPSRQFVASAQLAHTASDATAAISVWSVQTVTEVSGLHLHRQRVCALAFTCDGELLVSVGDRAAESESASGLVLAVWRWRDHALLVTVPVVTEEVHTDAEAGFPFPTIGHSRAACVHTVFLFCVSGQMLSCRECCCVLCASDLVDPRSSSYPHGVSYGWSGTSHTMDHCASTRVQPETTQRVQCDRHGYINLCDVCGPGSSSQGCCGSQASCRSCCSVCHYWLVDRHSRWQPLACG
jgi:hypothetical protein